VKRAVLLALCALALLGIASSSLAEDTVKLTINVSRHAYYRGEDVRTTVECANATNAPIRGASLTVSLSAWLSRTTEVGMIAAGGKAARSVVLPTASLKAGKYQVKAVLSNAGGVIAEATERIAIGHPPNPERLKVWLWGGGGDLDWYPRHGFTSCGGPSWKSVAADGSLSTSMREHLDQGLLKALDANIALNGGIRDGSDIDLSKIEDPEAVYKGGDSRVTLANPYHPEVIRIRDEANRRLMEAVKDYPQIRTSFFNTEVVDHMWGIENPAAIRLMKEKLGFSADEIGDPKYAAPGVIADDDRGYLFRKFMYQHANGLVMTNRAIAETVKKYRPDILTITDPYREVPLYGLFDGVDCIETWTYTNPDPKFMLYIETLRAACKPENQIPIQTVTMLNYPGELDPGDEWMLMGPGRVKVTTWINLSRAPSIVGYYYSSACNPVGADTFRVPYSTSAAIKELADTVFKPYGPMIRRLRVVPRRIAVLSSAAARLYAKSPRLKLGYDNLQIYHFYSVMAMAHLQADVLFDETIERYGLDGYDVLVLPKCDVLTKAVYDTILAFQKRGGMVIADQYLGPQVPGAITFDFDFTYRSKVNARAIAENKAYAQWDDHLEPGSAELQTVEGVTALDDQRIMESYAARLKQGLAGKVEPDVDCAEPTVLFNMCESGDARYLFVINDKRTYDERLGKFKSVLGKLLPQTTMVTVTKWNHPELYAFDMLARKPLEVAKAGSAYRFAVNLTELGGTIIALYPRPLDRVVVSAAENMETGKPGWIEIGVRDNAGKPAPGLQPLRVTITDPRGKVNESSDYYCAEEGVLRIPFTPALNDRPGKWSVTVEDLTASMTAEGQFAVVP
jgi:hypothetical protein